MASNYPKEVVPCSDNSDGCRNAENDDFFAEESTSLASAEKPFEIVPVVVAERETLEPHVGSEDAGLSKADDVQVIRTRFKSYCTYGLPQHWTPEVELQFEKAHREFEDSFTKRDIKILETLFRMANIAQDGLLNSMELVIFLETHGYVISSAEASKLISEGDADKDEALNFREFLAICKRSNLEGDLLTLTVTPSVTALLVSARIRKIFQRIFESIVLHTSITGTVNFFETKIAESGSKCRISSPMTSKKSKDCSSKVAELSKSKSKQKLPSVAETRIPKPGLNSENKVSRDKEAYGEGHSAAAQANPSSEKGQVAIGAEADPDIGDVKPMQQLPTVDRVGEVKIPAKAAAAAAPTAAKYDYDLIVIGSGAGGSAAAREAARLGKRVAIVDLIMPPSSTSDAYSARKFGGSCVSVGCVPKILAYHAGLIGSLLDKKAALPFGWFCSDDPNKDKDTFTNDWTTLVDNIQAHIRTLNYDRHFGLSYYKGIKHFNAYCEFDKSLQPHRLVITKDGQEKEYVTGEKIVIAVGSVYRCLDIPGAEHCITIDDTFSQRTHPGKVAIIGGGADAIEMAGLLAALNIRVTVMSRSPLLQGWDRGMVSTLLASLQKRGVTILSGWEVSKILKRGMSTTADSQDDKNLVLFSEPIALKGLGKVGEFNYNTVVLAVGKRPCTPWLKLDLADVVIDETTDKIWVDSADMTTQPDIFALGDCALGRPSETPINYQAGVSLSQRLFQGCAQLTPYDDHTIPKYLMAPIPYASIGVSEEEAVLEHGDKNVNVYQSSVRPIQYQLIERFKEKYVAKLITLKSEAERVIGLHYFGPNAGEIIQGFVLALKLKATKLDFDRLVAIHPTCAEVFTKLAKKSSLPKDQSGAAFKEAEDSYSC